MHQDFVGYRNRAAAFTRQAAQKLTDRLNAVFSPSDVGPHVTWRIKSPEATMAKLHAGKLRSDLCGGVIVNDFIGMRILAFHIGQIGAIVGIVEEWADDCCLVEVKRVDMFTDPDPGSYRAIHFDYVFRCAEDNDLPEYATVELQLTTYLQHFHGMLRHKLLYKPTTSPTRGVEQYLESLSEDLHAIDINLADFLCDSESNAELVSETNLDRPNKDR